MKKCKCCGQSVDNYLDLKKKIVEAWWDHCGWFHYDWRDIDESHGDVKFAEKIIKLVRNYKKFNKHERRI